MTRHRRALVGVGAAVVGLLMACLEPTQIDLTLRTDVPWAPSRRVAVTVGAPGSTEDAEPNTTVDGEWAANGEIGNLVLLPRDAKDEPISVRVVMGIDRDPSTCSLTDSKGCILARRKLAFVPHEPLQLPVSLYAACVGVPCDANSTCNALGQCVPADVDPTSCADGRVCDPSAADGLPPVDASSSGVLDSGSRPDGDRPTDGGVDGADGSISQDPDASDGASDGGGCPADMFVAPSQQLDSWGARDGDGVYTPDAPVGRLSTDNNEKLYYTRMVDVPPSSCRLRFVMDVASLEVAVDGIKMTILEVQRSQSDWLSLVATRVGDRYDLQLSGVPVVVPWDGESKLTLTIPLDVEQGPTKLEVAGVDHDMGANAVVAADPRVRIAYGLLTPYQTNFYLRSVSYFFAP